MITGFAIGLLNFNNHIFNWCRKQYHAHVYKFEFHIACITTVLLTSILNYSPTSAPSTAPGNVEVTRLNGTAINVSWVPLNLVEARGFIQGYVITYQQASNGSRHRGQTQMMQVNGSASYTLVGGLEPGAAYNVTVAGMTIQTGPGELG